MDPQNFLHPAGAAADRIANLAWFVLIVFAATTIVVWAILWWASVRRRGTFAEHAPVHAEGGQSFILIGGFAVPVAVLTLIFVLTMSTMNAYPMAKPAGAPVIRVVGHQWWFDAHYLFNPPSGDVPVPTEIHIPAGVPVEFQIDSADVIHSFWVPKLHGKIDMIPGRHNYIRIEADKPGVYQGQCAEFCGEEHANMRLQIVADTPEQYERWLALQRTPAQEPKSEDAKKGMHEFMNGPCAVCHTIRGTPAKGSVGPDLTHVASRRRIAGGALDNNTANLEAWITSAQSLKPGALMPDLTMMNGQQLRYLVAYLQTLK